MEKVDVLPVDDGGELVVFVELGLPGTPVVAGAPVLGEPAHLRDRNAVVQACAGELVGPSGTNQPLVQVVQLGLRNLDAEGPDVLADVAHEWISLIGGRYAFFVRSS